jgi:acetyl esterase/lipase
MNMMERLDPELVGPLEDLTTATGGGFSLRDIPATRAMVDAMLASMKANVPPIEGVESEDRMAGGFDGAPDVAVRVYRPSGAVGALPVLIWMHAGGYVLGDLELDDFMLRHLVKVVGCAVVSVDYRLAPEHPFPAALDDCYSVLDWVGAGGAGSGIDTARIAVGGASAGAGLATALALLARDRSLEAISFQLLIYPAINDSNTEQVGQGVPENLFWSRENTLRSWQAYLDGREGSTDVSAYAAPIRAADLSRLPPAYVAIGTLDMFLPDTLDYVRRLTDAGVTTELHVYPDAFHAFDAFAPMARVSQRFVADRDAALRRALALE